MRKDDFKRLVQSRKASIAQARASAKKAAGRVFKRVLLGDDHPFSKVTTEKTLDRISVRDCATFASSLGPKGARLFVVGAIDRAELERVLNPLMKGWKGKDLTRQVPKLVAAKPRVALIHIPDAEQSMIMLGHVGPGRRASDYEATMLMSRILGGSFSSRINMNIREDKGYSYGARAGFRYFKDGGYFAASSSVKTDTTGAALKEIIAEIRRMTEAPPTDAEMSRERDGALLALPARFATGRSILGTYSSLVGFGLPLDYYSTYPDRLRAATGADLLAAAKAHLRQDGLTILVAGDAKVVRPQLEKALEDGILTGEFVMLDADGLPTK
jgi:zinc protease